jgi:hypothetical protein
MDVATTVIEWFARGYCKERDRSAESGVRRPLQVMACERQGSIGQANDDGHKNRERTTNYEHVKQSRLNWRPTWESVCNDSMLPHFENVQSR